MLPIFVTKPSIPYILLVLVSEFPDFMLYRILSNYISSFKEMLSLWRSMETTPTITRATSSSTVL